MPVSRERRPENDGPARLIEAQDADRSPRSSGGRGYCAAGGSDAPRPGVVWSVSERSRPDGVGTPTASSTRALDPELRLQRPCAEQERPPRVVRRRLVPRIRTGDEVGTGVPNTSAALAVFPPEVEK